MQQPDRNKAVGRIAAVTSAMTVLAMTGLWMLDARPALAHGNLGGALVSSAATARPDGLGALAQDTSGKAIFHGKGACFACHGQGGVGTPLAPNLTDTVWLHVKDGNPDSIAALVKRGVPSPKEFPQAMPPMGGAQLTDAEVQAVARYVASLSRGGG